MDADWKKLSNFENVLERVAFNPENVCAVADFFNASIEDRIVLLQSVRNESDMPDYVKKFVSDSRAKGKQVYVPMIHNDQKDPHSGVLICNTMRYVIENCSKVAIAYNPASEGTKFDYGLTLMNRKSTLMINDDIELDKDDQVGALIKFKHYLDNNIALEDANHVELVHGFDKLRKTITNSRIMPIAFEYVSRGEAKPPALHPISAILFGMVYASRKPFELLKVDDVESQAKREDELGYPKSYSKVALILDRYYNL